MAITNLTRQLYRASNGSARLVGSGMHRFAQKTRGRWLERKTSSIKCRLSEGGPSSVKSMVSWRTSFKAACRGSSSLAMAWPSLWESAVPDEVVFEDLEGLLASIASTSASNNTIMHMHVGRCLIGVDWCWHGKNGVNVRQMPPKYHLVVPEYVWGY